MKAFSQCGPPSIHRLKSGGTKGKPSKFRAELLKEQLVQHAAVVDAMSDNQVGASMLFLRVSDSAFACAHFVCGAQTHIDCEFNQSSSPSAGRALQCDG